MMDNYIFVDTGNYKVFKSSTIESCGYNYDISVLALKAGWPAHAYFDIHVIAHS